MSNTTNNEVEALRRELIRLSQENEALKVLGGSSETYVIIKHSGTGPQLSIPTSDTSSKLIDRDPKRSTVKVPYDIYIMLKENTDWFEKGYIYSDLEDLDSNPNLILDIETWVNSKTEKQIPHIINKIDSIGTMNALYFYTEGKSSTGKMLVLRQACRERLSELFDADVVED